MSDSMNTTRRNFLTASSATAAAALATGLASRSYAAENNEIKIALIGAGGRGTDACVQALSTSGPIKLHVMADAFDDRLQLALNTIKTRVPERVDVPKERQFVGLDAYKKAIDSDVDGVILTTPPGFRPYHFEYAVQKGKQIFMEKPVATDAPGIRRVLAAAKIAKEKNLKVTVGLQRHYDVQYQETLKRIKDGMIGDILYFRSYWDGGPLWVKPRESSQSEFEYQVRNWYYFAWLSGDHIVEQHIHNIDVCNWVMGGPPQSAQSHAGRQVRTGKDYGEIYDHHAVEFCYGEKWNAPGVRQFSYCRQVDGTYTSVTEHVYGTKGYCDLSGFTIYDHKGDRLWRYDPKKDSSLPKPRNPYQVEHDVLWDAVRNNTERHDVEYGASSTMTAILGRQAGYTGKLIKYEDVMNSEMSLAPDTIDWKATPKSLPNPDGTYPIPMPGTYNKI